MTNTRLTTLAGVCVALGTLTIAFGDRVGLSVTERERLGVVLLFAALALYAPSWVSEIRGRQASPSAAVDRWALVRSCATWIAVFLPLVVLPRVVVGDGSLRVYDVAVGIVVGVVIGWTRWSDHRRTSRRDE